MADSQDESPAALMVGLGFLSVCGILVIMASGAFALLSNNDRAYGLLGAAMGLSSIITVSWARWVIILLERIARNTAS